MTAATRDDSRSEPEDDEYSAVRWNDRAMFGRFRGLPWWWAVLIAFVVAIVGTFVDLNSAQTVGWVFAVTFFVGCVGAVVFVERRSMFGPIVQPPLVLAIVVPVLVVLTQGMPGSGGLAAVGLTLGKPLIDGFPAMAITTACTVIIGIIRVTTQKDPNRPTKDEVREAKGKPRRSGAGRDGGKAVPEDRPKRPRGDAPGQDRPRRPAPPADEDRPKRPRPQSGGAQERPRRSAAPGRDGNRGRRGRPSRDED